MNGIESIKNKITDAAKLEADEVLRKSAAETERILSDAKKQAEKETAAILQKGEKQAAEAYDRIMSSASSQQRKDILAVKQELIGQAFAEAYQKLKALSGSRYEDLLVKYVTSNADGSETLVFGKEDTQYAKSVCAKAAEQLSDAGKKASLTVSEENADFNKGVLLRRNGLEINCSLKAIAESMKEQLTSEVAKMLF